MWQKLFPDIPEERLEPMRKKVAEMNGEALMKSITGMAVVFPETRPEPERPSTWHGYGKYLEEH